MEYMLKIKNYENFLLRKIAHREHNTSDRCKCGQCIDRSVGESDMYVPLDVHGSIKNSLDLFTGHLCSLKTRYRKEMR